MSDNCGPLTLRSYNDSMKTRNMTTRYDLIQWQNSLDPLDCHAHSAMIAETPSPAINVPFLYPIIHAPIPHNLPPSPHPVLLAVFGIRVPLRRQHDKVHAGSVGFTRSSKARVSLDGAVYCALSRWTGRCCGFDCRAILEMPERVEKGE